MPTNSGESQPGTSPPDWSATLPGERPSDPPDEPTELRDTLVRPPGSARPDPGSEPPVPAVPGYELLGVLGRGGMGVIYKARDRALKRTVALKMILAGGLAGPHELTRFRIEAEAVARLIHPNIVQLYEVGECDGRPYCALEFVDGGSLAQKLADGPLPPPDAADLVGTLARAMQLAHSRNVVHRDLKPANVLLTADGTPKITDFGLARQLDTDSGETRDGVVMGTPSYMAPEQASGHGHAAGPAAEVYALGALLYHCLTGRPPFKGETLVETLDQVRTRAPVPPSHARPGIPLDLETICLKCLGKEPERRYASAAELADDLARYRRGEPIRARPVGRAERAVKWVKRNPVVTVAVLTVAAALTAGTAVSYQKYLDAEEQRAVAQRKREEAEGLQRLANEQRAVAETQSALAVRRQKEAEEQTETAEQVSRFLSGLFEDADPIARTGRGFGVQRRGDGPLTALEVVDRGAEALKHALRDKPRVRAALLDRIGNVYLELGRAQAAEPLLREALALRLQQFGPDHPEYAASLQSVGLLHMSRAEPVPACEAFEQALALRRKHLGENDPLTADTLFNLGTQRTLLAEYAEAERCLEACLAIRSRQFGEDSREVAAVLFMLGQTYLSQEDVERAVPLLTKGLALVDKIGGNNDFGAVVALFTQAQLADKIGPPGRARELYREVDARVTKLLGGRHYLVAFCRNQFAWFLIEHGEPDAGIAMLRGVVEVYRESFGENSAAVAGTVLNLARAERNRGLLREAEEHAAEAVRILRKLRADRPNQPARGTTHAASLHVLGSLVYNRGDFTAAARLYREGLAILLQPEAADAPRKSSMGRQLAMALLRREDAPVSPEFANAAKPSGKPKVDLDLADTWARAARALPHLSPPTADDPAVLEYFRAQAVLMLRSAVAGGSDATTIEANEAFKPLRGRADFDELLGAPRRKPAGK